MPPITTPIFKAQYVVASISTLGYWTPLRMAGGAGAARHAQCGRGEMGRAGSEFSTEPSTVVHAAPGAR